MDDRQRERIERQAAIVSARTRRLFPHEGLPPPPYHVRDVDMIYLLCRFDPEEARSMVPEGVSPSGTGWGVIAMYTVGSGWGIAPYSGFFMGFELEGLDSNDTSPSQYLHSGIYSNLGFEVLHSLYNANFKRGWTRFTRNGDEVIGEAGTDEAPLVRITVTLKPVPQELAGTSRYIGRLADGTLISYSVAWSSEWVDVTVKSVEFLAGAEAAVRVVRPLEYYWTVMSRGMSMAFTPPRPLGDALQWRSHDAQIVGLVEMFSGLRRAAAIMTREGTLLSLNSAAERLVEAGALIVEGRVLVPLRASDRSVLSELLASTLDRPISDRRAIAVPGGGSILVQAISLSPDIAGTDRVLVCFDDPAGDSAADPKPALQLLGLTPAEARIAALVGSGQAPREAAAALDLSLNTVRSALKIAFDKLGISRQAELAKIVARLAG